mmetsp:Transcript_14682/g.34944  ORF Transcript_14682/g.34944 Transcript_14682/m.34944 type:complete len:173 (+) Transcript_14682:2463-2981(+)
MVICLGVKDCRNQLGFLTGEPLRRYHQRGWTLQEFCSASSLVVRDQPHLDDEVLGSQCVVGDEDSRMRELREWCTKRLSHCRPFWIYGGVAAAVGSESEDSLRACFQKYLKASASVQTEDPRDMLRALYPLMTNTPVEDQRELISLVKQLTELLNVEEPRLQSLYERAHIWD